MGLVHWFPTFGPAHFGNGGTKDAIVELLEAITTSTKSCSLSKMAHIKLVALVYISCCCIYALRSKMATGKERLFNLRKTKRAFSATSLNSCSSFCNSVILESNLFMSVIILSAYITIFPL